MACTVGELSRNIVYTRVVVFEKRQKDRKTERKKGKKERKKERREVGLFLFLVELAISFTKAKVRVS